MTSRSALVAVAAAQLAAQAAGHVVALRRRRHFDVPFLTGSPEHIVRDWLWFGTAYSAPPYLLGPQAWATARLLGGPDDRALGAPVAGYGTDPGLPERAVEPCSGPPGRIRPARVTGRRGRLGVRAGDGRSRPPLPMRRSGELGHATGIVRCRLDRPGRNRLGCVGEQFRRIVR